MRRFRLCLTFIVTVIGVSQAHAQSESDRLRDALRNATAQARSLEDQRAALQAKLTAAEQERDRLKKQNDGLRAISPC